MSKNKKTYNEKRKSSQDAQQIKKANKNIVKLANNINAKMTSSKDHKSLVTVGYDQSKHNALKHGILSRYTVMAWENEKDYQTLLDLLIAEHTPKGITEEHLVEELAGVIWRKMRLRYAENTSIQTSLNNRMRLDSFSCDSHDDAKDALLVKSREVKGFDIREAVLATDDETQEELRGAKERLDCFLEAEKILLGSDCYDQGLVTLPKDDREDWQNGDTDRYKGEYDNFGHSYDNTAEGLLSWVIKATKVHKKYIYELENRDKIKKQILGQSFLSHFQLNTYSRYENHLDKKFGKTLGMLLKLKALRGDIELITPI